MTDIVIKAENIYKEYKLGVISTGTLRRDLQSWWAKVRGKQDPNSVISYDTTHEDDIKNVYRDNILALKDISFEVKRGELIGLIGKNGAGKSTLLKIISKITTPTKGIIKIKGRIGSLLEVGTGFHPELTGKENIYLNGTILGMKKREIDKKMDEIISFSEIEKFIDTPVKRYSSGMYVRLAFAVAAHLEPEILLVDEVLAVGDAEFQKKCLGKMSEVSKEGRTILFVSHNMGAINSLTEKCILLKNGELLLYDKTGKIIETYLSEGLNKEKKLNKDLDSYRQKKIINPAAYLTDVWINENKDNMPVIEMGEKITIYGELNVKANIKGACFCIMLKNITGTKITIFFSWDKGFYLDLEPGKRIIKLEVKDLLLPPGQYFIDIGINRSDKTYPYDNLVDFPAFQVVKTKNIMPWMDRPWGAIHYENVTWNVE